MLRLNYYCIDRQVVQCIMFIYIMETVILTVLLMLSGTGCVHICGQLSSTSVASKLTKGALHGASLKISANIHSRCSSYARYQEYIHIQLYGEF